MTLILAACSNKKHPSPPGEMRASALQPGAPAAVMQAWASRVRAAPVAGPARTLYRGSSWYESLRAAKQMEARLGVISAGLGYVEAETSVPTYGLTVARGGADSIDAKINGDFSPADWWARLTAERLCGADLPTALDGEDGLVLVALPELYLSMVAAQLAPSRAATDGRLRIFTRGGVPESLAEFAMPYDARLDAEESNWRGTLSNAAPRALSHFAERIFLVAPTANGPAHAAAVTAALASYTAPTMIKRTAKSDEEIKMLLATHWDAGRGVAGRLLRILRDEMLVACEHSRARRLVAEVAAERAES